MLVASSALLILGFVWPWALTGLILTLPLSALGLYDVTQRRHSILRNYPVIGHMRFLLEDLGPELHQYVVESDTDGRPFNRDTRSLIYERAKNTSDKKPFGTELDVYAEGYGWIGHSMAARPKMENAGDACRVLVGGPQCKKPYSSSVLNISAMSFGAISPNAIRAMNAGARRGGFAHVTGEGGLSAYHREKGGDLIWQIGTGYFGCRTAEGTFDPDRFAEQASLDQVKMIEIKLSQGAKPGHGGVLPAAKITEEISHTRGVPMGVDCVSPSYHSAFSSPRELVEFVSRLRDLSGGKPVGIKLCVGRSREFLAVCKAMVETGIAIDFITVDGAEGGTGAAPLELSNHVGMPLMDGLLLVRNGIVGAGLRDQVRIAASGKMVTAAGIAGALALGADWCNTARAFMFAVGCIQSQRCHTNECPVGVATQDSHLQRALDVSDKSERVYHYHHNTVEALAEIVAAAGLEHPSELTPHHFFARSGPHRVHSFAQSLELLEPGQLIDGDPGPTMRKFWDEADIDRFAPH